MCEPCEPESELPERFRATIIAFRLMRMPRKLLGFERTRPVLITEWPPLEKSKELPVSYFNTDHQGYFWQTPYYFTRDQTDELRKEFRKLGGVVII